MQRQTTQPELVAEEPPAADLDSFASYDDGDALVVCDRSNPNAWIRSDATTTVDA